MNRREQIEDLLFHCLESEDFEGAVDDVCSRHADLSEDLRRLAGSMRERGFVDLTSGLDAREIGGHRVVERLGEGGMGVIYRCVQPGTGREVALKVLRPELLHFDSSRARFQREIEAIARLSHPAIVPVFEASTDEKTQVPFFTMRYVRGASLATVLHWLRGRDPATLRGEDVGAAVADISGIEDRGAWSGDFVDVMLHTFASLAGALEHAHEAGVLHRDLKPSNILLTSDGRAQILDFGLASLQGAERLSGSGPVGTPAYMPPEVLGDRTPIPNVSFDIYGLGLVMYEALGLVQPFLRDGAEATRRSILRGDVQRLRARNPSVSWELETVCHKAIALEAEERYPDVTAFARDLHNVAENRPIVARRPSLPRRVRRWAQRHATLSLALATAVSVALVAAVLLWNTEREGRSRAEHLTLEAEKSLYSSQILTTQYALKDLFVKQGQGTLARCKTELRDWEWGHLSLLADASRRIVTTHDAAINDLAISVDGSILATASDDKTARVLDRASGEILHTIEHPDAVHGVKVSPDGRFVVTCAADKKLRVHRVRDGSLVREADLRAQYALGPFTADGEAVYVGMNDKPGVAVVSIPAGTVLRELVTEKAHVECIRVDPTGTRLLAAGSGVCTVWSVPGYDRIRRIETQGGMLNAACFTKDGREVWTASNSFRTGPRVEFWSVATGQSVAPSLPNNLGELVTIPDAGTFACSRALVRMRADHKAGLGWFGHVQPIHALVGVDGSESLFSGSLDGTVREWCTTAHPAREWREGHTRPISTIEFTPSGDHVLSADTGGGLRAWDARAPEPATAAETGASSRAMSVLVPDETTAYLLSKDARLARYTVPTLALEDAHDLGDFEAIGAVYVGDEILVAGADGVVRVVDPRRLREVRRFSIDERTCAAVAFVDAEHVVLAAKSGLVRVVKADGSVVREHDFGSAVSCLAGSPSGDTVLVAVGSQGAISAWEWRSNRIVRQYRGHSTKCSSIVYARSGTRFFSLSLGVSLCVWNPEREEYVLAMNPKTNMGLALGLSRRGDLAIGGLNRRLALFRSVRRPR